MDVITAVYEKGVLRPLKPLPLAEKQTVRIQIMEDDPEKQIIQELIALGLITPPSRKATVKPVSEAELRAIADRLGRAAQRPLSEIIIEEREGL
jgi:predicted DNA-binding antitoxin AbrB/MazE fold protein